MQHAGVIPITTTVAALSETVNSGIILPDNKQKWNEFIKIIRDNSRSLNKLVAKSNKSFAKTKTWDQRAYEWKNIIDKL